MLPRDVGICLSDWRHWSLGRVYTPPDYEPHYVDEYTSQRRGDVDRALRVLRRCGRPHYASCHDAVTVARGLSTSRRIHYVASWPGGGFRVLSEFEKIPMDSEAQTPWLMETGVVYLPPDYSAEPAFDAVREAQLGMSEEDRRW